MTRDPNGDRKHLVLTAAMFALCTFFTIRGHG